MISHVIFEVRFRLVKIWKTAFIFPTTYVVEKSYLNKGSQRALQPMFMPSKLFNNMHLIVNPLFNPRLNLGIPHLVVL